MNRFVWPAIAWCALVLLVPGTCVAQPAPSPAPIIVQHPRLLPVLAPHGMVASQEAQATRVGVAILERGGNAVDAAVAVGFALAVTLPRAGNLGGGGFMVVHLAGRGEQFALDYRETAPASARPDMFLGPDGEPDVRLSRASGRAVGVPGTVAGLAEAHARWGSGRLTLADLIAPAMRLAREGITVEDDLLDSLNAVAPRLARHPSSAAIFLRDGKAPPRGSRLVQTDLAATLERIAAEGPKGFYTGPVAERIALAVTQTGGGMTPADLAAYRPIVRKPVTGTYRGRTIVSMPPPSSGGTHLIQILNILEGFDLAAMGAGSADAIHIMAEAMRRAYADRSEHMGDPDRIAVPVEWLASKDYAARLRAAIDRVGATPSVRVLPGIAPGTPQARPAIRREGTETTHYSVVDRDGNAVSNTYTLNFSYGLGLVADGTGVLLNNELDDFAAKAGAANAFGLVQGAANLPAPGKRPLSSMTPTIVLKDGRVELVTGSPGGSRIISTTLQTIVNGLDHRMNIAEAVAFPRIHHQWLPDELVVESGLSPDTLRFLRARGHSVVERAASGSANSIAVTAQGLAGAADPRQRGTLAAGH